MYAVPVAIEPAGVAQRAGHGENDEVGGLCGRVGLGVTESSEWHAEAQICEPISTSSEDQRVLARSKLLRSMATYPDRECGYLVFLTLTWPI